MTTLASSLATELRNHCDQAFALMGNGNAHLIDALIEQGVAISEVRHEQATVASADAYTRITGKLAIATTTYGAGFTNTLTALAEAVRARTPMLVVVGEAPSTGLRQWDIDQELAASAIGVRTMILSQHNVAEKINRAVARALRNRRPIVIGIPYDLVTAEIPAVAPVEIDLNDPATMASLAAATLPATQHSEETLPVTSTTSIELAAAVQLLSAAKRPVVLAGHGAHLAGAQAELDEISARLGALTASTALAQGIFSDKRYDLGITGGFGQLQAMQKISEADVVLAVGASLNQFTMRFGELFGDHVKLIRVDIDPVDTPKNNHSVEQLLLRGDAKAVLSDLLGALDSANLSGGWRESVAGLEAGGELRARDAGSATGLCEDGRLDPRAVAAKLAKLLPADRHVTSDGGHFIGWANMYWPVASPERMIMVGTAYQTIGLGFATVAGVAAAAPDSTVVLTTGDGGGLMALADLETTIRTANSCVVVVWNDGVYGAEVHLYGEMGLDQSTMKIGNTNFAGLASALGANGVVVEKLSDLDALKSWVDAGATGTILLDCRISKSVVAEYQREIQRVNGINTPESAVAES